MTNKLIVTDEEMGGLSLDHSLLEAYFGVYDSMFRPLGDLDIRIKHDPYILSAQGMSVNRIDIVAHDLIAEYKTTAGKKLYEFLKLHSDNGTNKLTVVGHGVHGDMQFIFKQLLNMETFEQFTSYRYIDTSVINTYLQLQGIVPQSVSGSLSSLAEYYNIPIEGQLHSAKTDAILTIKVLQRQLQTE